MHAKVSCVNRSVSPGRPTSWFGCTFQANCGPCYVFLASQVSFHRYGDYFPGTGAIDDLGHGSGKGYCVNVPLKDGMDDESYRYVYEPIMSKVSDAVCYWRGSGCRSPYLSLVSSGTG